MMEAATDSFLKGISASAPTKRLPKWFNTKENPASLPLQQQQNQKNNPTEQNRQADKILNPKVFELGREGRAAAVPCIPEYTKLYDRYQALKESESSLQASLKEIRDKFSQSEREVAEYKGKVDERVQLELRERKLRMDMELERVKQSLLQANQKLREAASTIQLRNNQIFQLQEAVRQMSALITKRQADYADLQTQYQQLGKKLGPEFEEKLESAKLDVESEYNRRIAKEVKRIQDEIKRGQLRSTKAAYEGITGAPIGLTPIEAPPQPSVSTKVESKGTSVEPPKVTPIEAQPQLSMNTNSESSGSEGELDTSRLEKLLQQLTSMDIPDTNE